MRHMSIKVKLVVAVLVSLAVFAAANAWLVRFLGDRSVRLTAEQSVKTAGQSFAALERDEVDKLSAALDALLGNGALVEAFAKRDRAQLEALATPIFNELKARHAVTHWYFIDPQRVCLLRVHRPDLSGDVVNRVTLLKAIETKDAFSGKELGKTAFALRVVRPVVRGAELIGYMELGEEIDHFLGRMKDQTGDDFGMFVEKRFLDAREWAQSRGSARSGWDDRRDVVLVDATTTDPSATAFDGEAEPIPDAGLFLQELTRGSATFARGVVPVRDASGQKVGGLVVVHDITTLHDNMKDERAGILVLLALLALFMSFLLAVLVDRLIFARLGAMIEKLEDLSARLAGGDYEIGADLASGRKDEIGRFETFVSGVLVVIADALRGLEQRTRRPG